MKVAFLSPFYPFRGGIAQFSANLYRAFEKKQHQVKACTFTRQYPDFLFPGKTQYVTDADKADPIPAERILDSINPVTWLTTARKINNFNPQILLTRFWIPFFGPSFGTVQYFVRKKGAKVIAIVDNAVPHEKRPGDIPFTKLFLNQTDGFVVMSKQVERDLLSLKPDAKYFFHPHPVYDHFGKPVSKQVALEQLQIPANKKVLLFFGLIRKYKGLDILLQALAKLPEEYFLVVAGEAYEDIVFYENIIKENYLENRVILVNRYILDDEVPLYFSAADVCVLPYRSATQSGITAVALHFGVPVIATDVGGLGEIINPYKIGLTVSEPEPSLFANAVESFFKDPSEYGKNISVFKEKFSWENLAEEIVRFGEEL
jgi:glycosyltransferase involved in cell wall biosynthesis